MGFTPVTAYRRVQVVPPSVVANCRPSAAVTVAVRASLAMTAVKSSDSGNRTRSPGASIDRANDGAGTADEPTRRSSTAPRRPSESRPRRHGTDRPRSLRRRASAARDGHRATRQRTAGSGVRISSTAATLRKLAEVSRRRCVSPRGYARSRRVGDHDALLECLLSRRRRALSLVRLRRLTVLGLVGLGLIWPGSG